MFFLVLTSSYLDLNRHEVLEVGLDVLEEAAEAGQEVLEGQR